MIRTPAYIALFAALALTACDRPEDQETGSMSREDVRSARDDLDPAVRTALDSGNAAYRARDYEEALRHFQDAAEADEDVAAAWFGIYMAQLALGHVEEANDAMARAQSLAPGASLIHPDSVEARPAAAGDTRP